VHVEKYIERKNEHCLRTASAWHHSFPVLFSKFDKRFATEYMKSENAIDKISFNDKDLGGRILSPETIIQRLPQSERRVATRSIYQSK